MKTAHERAIEFAQAANLSRLLHTAKRGVSMDATPDLVGARVDAAVALDRAGVPYALIGGFAVGLHATPRATIDVNVAVRTADRDRAASAMEEGGFTVSGTVSTQPKLRAPQWSAGSDHVGRFPR